MARQERTGRRGQRSPEIDGEENSEQHLQEIVWSIDAEQGKAKSPCSRLGIASRFSSRYRLRSSINFAGIQCHPVLPQRYFPKALGSVRYRGICRQGRGRDEPVVHDDCHSVIDRLGRRTLLLIRLGGHGRLSPGVAAIFFMRRNQDLLVWLPDRLHRLFRIFTGGSDLGVHRRGLP